MKKSLLLCTTLVPLILYLFASCDNSKNITEADSVFEENPTTIAWSQDKSSDKITSYQTDVQVYRMNSREDTGLKLSDKYKMSVKMIDMFNIHVSIWLLILMGFIGLCFLMEKI